jgi:hypothetical protein
MARMFRGVGMGEPEPAITQGSGRRRASQTAVSLPVRASQHRPHETRSPEVESRPLVPPSRVHGDEPARPVMQNPQSGELDLRSRSSRVRRDPVVVVGVRLKACDVETL